MADITNSTSRSICGSHELVNSGTGIRFLITVDDVTHPAFAIRHKGKVHAYFNRCAHKLTELDWQPGHFFDQTGEFLICATHGALYKPDTGLCIAGPCRGAKLVKLDMFENNNNQVCLKDADKILSGAALR